MGRGGGKKKGEFSVYDQNIIDETQWETMLSREVNLLTVIIFINLICAIFYVYLISALSTCNHV